MSYILDALKKSEKKRQHGSITEMLAVQDAVVLRSRKRALWPYLISIALVVNAGVFVWWLHPWQKEKGRETASTKIGVTSSSEAQGMPAKALERERPAIAEKAVPADGAKQPAAAVGPKREQPVKRGHAIPAESPPKDTAKAAPGQKVIAFAELPQSVQQGMPALTVSAHYYDSNPASRVVSINGRVVREGQNVAAGITLERITPDGVVLGFQGYRFSMGIF